MAVPMNREVAFQVTKAKLVDANDTVRSRAIAVLCGLALAGHEHAVQLSVPP